MQVNYLIADIHNANRKAIVSTCGGELVALELFKKNFFITEKIDAQIIALTRYQFKEIRKTLTHIYPLSNDKHSK